MSISKKTAWVKSLRYVFLAVLMVVIDQGSKLWMERNLVQGESREVIKNFFYLSLHYNPGAAFSILAEHDWGIYILAALSLVASLLFIYGIFKAQSMLGKYIAAMLAAGTLGNGIDRVLFGKVVDFLDFHFGTYVFPTFNWADILLTVHIILLIFLILFRRYDPFVDLGIEEKAERDGKGDSTPLSAVDVPTVKEDVNG